MISFNITTYIDATSKFADQVPLLQRALAVVGRILDREVVSAANANVQLHVEIETDAEVDGDYSAAAAPNYSGMFQSTPGGPVPVPGGLVNDVEYKIQTGKSGLIPFNGPAGADNWYSNVADGFLFISEETMTELVAKGAAPFSENDTVIALLLHEVLHLLGYAGDEEALTAPLGSVWMSEFDELVFVDGQDAWFSGRAATAIYGDYVPLRPLDSWTNVHHLDVINPLPGQDDDEYGGVHAGSDLMNGLLVDGMKISDLDVAVLVDLGYRNVRTLVSDDGQAFIPGVGAVSLQGTSGSYDGTYFHGERGGFSVSQTNGTVTVTSKSAPADVAKLNGMEMLLFADGNLGTEFIGTDGADVVRGTAASQTLYGGRGDDLLVSGGGVDVAVFSGNASEYAFVASGGKLTVTDKLGRDGKDTLDGVQRLWFADKYLAMDIDGNAGDMYRLYQAAFDRKPDVEGLSFWIYMLDELTTLADIASAFTTTAEFADLYGANPTNSSALTKFYQNVLHREPEKAGFEYWLDVLNKGVPLSDVLLSFSDSAENQTQVIGSISGGIEYLTVF